MQTHVDYLEYCVKIAKNGIGSTSPNPIVGSVIVHNNTILAEGWHHAYGSDHAERVAISKIKAEHKYLLKESTLYISLEPCNHFGKTPPCTELIISSGIQKVVIGRLDPNPIMSGKSIQVLKSKGIDVIGPYQQFEQDSTLSAFTINQKFKRPYVILKWAQSNDNFIGHSNVRTKISNSYSDILAHYWRAECDGILVGYNTFLIDRPELTTRLWYGKNPKKFILRKEPKDNLNPEKYNDFTFLNEDDELYLILHKLYTLHNIGILIVEGGYKTLNRFIQSQTWDEARVITNHFLKLKQGIRAPWVVGRLQKSFTFDSDSIQIIKNT